MEAASDCGKDDEAVKLDMLLKKKFEEDPDELWKILGKLPKLKHDLHLHRTARAQARAQALESFLRMAYQTRSGIDDVLRTVISYAVDRQPVTLQTFLFYDGEILADNF